MQPPRARPPGAGRALYALRQRIRDLEAVAAARDQVAAAVRARQARYEQLFEHSQSVKLVIDPATDRLLDANPAAAAFYDYSRAALRRRRLSDLTLPPPQLADLAAKAQRAGATRCVVEQRLASGEQRTVDVHTSPLALDGRDVQYAIIHDITAEQQAARAALPRHFRVCRRRHYARRCNRRATAGQSTFCMIVGYSQEALLQAAADPTG